MTAPERIWAAPPTDDPEWESGSGEWDVSENWAASCITEYVRADLAAVPAQDTTWDQYLAECHCPQPDPRDEVFRQLECAVTLYEEYVLVAGGLQAGEWINSARAALAAAKAVRHG